MSKEMNIHQLGVTGFFFFFFFLACSFSTLNPQLIGWRFHDEDNKPSFKQTQRKTRTKRQYRHLQHFSIC